MAKIFLEDCPSFTGLRNVPSVRCFRYAVFTAEICLNLQSGIMELMALQTVQKSIRNIKPNCHNDDPKITCFLVHFFFNSC